MRLVRLWFGSSERVTRLDYVVSGVLLMALKYALDALAIYLSSGQILMPIDFMSPLFATRDRLLGGSAGIGTLLTMGLWALLFLWIGASMSVRRAIDAGLTPWIGLLFVFPFLNLLVIALLSFVPTSKTVSTWSKVSPSTEASIRSALFGVAAGAAIAFLGIGVSVLAFKEYGLMLFFATPFVMGASAGYVHNARRPRTLSSTVGVAMLSLLVSAGAILLLALEGALCIAMASPLAALSAAMGASFGRTIAKSRASSAGLASVVVAMPLLMGVGHEPSLDVREVVTRIELDAPPERVWPNVVRFAELSEVPNWVFRLGIAYPVRAVIEGEGVGAVRHCEFSTGSFVEPITAWEPPSRLSFDVASQPAPMHEWSPYRHVHPPHLDGYLRTVRGEFRLKPLSNGGTLLEGSTWYMLDLHPAGYWALWSDALIHQIHQRVLRHIGNVTLRATSQ